MKWRRVILIAVACLAAVVIAFVFWPGEREPEYQGKKLSEWIRGGSPIWDRAPGGIERVKAVRQIGTNGLPFLVKWISRGAPPGPPNKVEAVVRRLNRKASRIWLDFRYKNNQRARDAVWAFRVLGPEARPAIPELLQVLRNEDPSVAALGLRALDHIGRDSVPILLGVLTNRAMHGVSANLSLAGTMRGLGTNSDAAVPTLIGCLTNADSSVAATAAVLLGNIAADADRVLPALTNAFDFTNLQVRCSAVYAAGYFEDKGYLAVPALTRLLADPEQAVRRAATNALKVIAPEVLRTNAVSER